MELLIARCVNDLLHGLDVMPLLYSPPSHFATNSMFLKSFPL